MIPKIIHYCWFGHGRKSQLVERCIASWRRKCANYQILEWNESNFPITKYAYVKEAYDSGKWAFVSDFVRLYALYNTGGVYLDTDVELLDGLDDFLDNRAFVGYAESTYLGTGTIGAEKKNEWIGFLLECYKNKHFMNNNGTEELIPNNDYITVVSCRKLGLNIGDKNIRLGNVRLYPTDVFSPYKRKIIGCDKKVYEFNNYSITGKTIAIHHNELSWIGEISIIERILILIKQTFRICLPIKYYWAIKRYRFKQHHNLS